IDFVALTDVDWEVGSGNGADLEPIRGRLNDGRGSIGGLNHPAPAVGRHTRILCHVAGDRRDRRPAVDQEARRMPIDARLDPEMAVTADWDPQFLTVRLGRARGFGAQPLPKVLKLSAKGEEYKEGGEDADPDENHLERLADRQPHGEQRAQEEDDAHRIIDDLG